MNAPDEVEQREEGADQEQSASNNLHGNMGSSMSLSVSFALPLSKTRIARPSCVASVTETMPVIA
jgi:hypothetical protein